MQAATPSNLSGFEDMADDLLDGPQYDSANVKALVAPVGNVVYKENCRKCGGSGRYHHVSSLGHNICTHCKGVGFFEYRTSPQHRADKRAKSAARKVANEQKALEAKKQQGLSWLQANPDIGVWLRTGKASGNSFALSLLEALKKWGSLTEGQARAVHNAIARDAEREIARQQIAAKAPEVTIARVEEAFSKAISAKFDDASFTATGGRLPVLRLDEFKLKPARATSNNPGAIYVTLQEEGTYLGKIAGGRFIRSRDCDDSTEARVVAAASNPEEAAVRYARLTGKCGVCNRHLVDPESINRGIGPICASRYGF